ncbi:MAG TPA: acyl-CoA synthetase [Candidatus Limnocylindria bacterium]|nr:acyl-CoA synthetase [Candidatus Limnocylindria bacterium]
MTPFAPWVWDIPPRFNIAAACADVHARSAIAQRAAVIVDDVARGVQTLTFAELAERTGRLAAVLEDLGVAAGERVLVRLPNCLEYPIAFLGTLKRGAVAVPASMLLTPDEVRHLAADSEAAVLVTDPPTLDALGESVRTLPALRHVLLVGGSVRRPAGGVRVHNFAQRLAAVPRIAPAADTAADDPAYLVYTSGTTGYPKGVVHAHRALLGRQPSSEYWFDFLPTGDRVLHAGKYNWTYTLGTGLMDPLYRGHTAIVAEGPPDATRWPRLMATHRATTFVAVPTVYRQILEKTTAGRADVPTLRHCMSAGEPLSPDVAAAWRVRFGLEIYEGLGMTECSYYISATRSRPIRPGAAGFVQPGHDVALLDPDTWRPVPTGEEGMLCIPRSDPCLMRAYWRQPEETAACFHGDWFLTGDYARQDADGYVWFVGRRDDLVKSFGYRVSPYEVERVLRQHPDVADAAATGEEVAPQKTLVVAYVVPRPGSSLTAEALLAWAHQHLASYKAPRIAYLVDDLPRTRNGKVQRRALSATQARASAQWRGAA